MSESLTILPLSVVGWACLRAGVPAPVPPPPPCSWHRALQASEICDQLLVTHPASSFCLSPTSFPFPANSTSQSPKPTHSLCLALEAVFHQVPALIGVTAP